MPDIKQYRLKFFIGEREYIYFIIRMTWNQQGKVDTISTDYTNGDITMYRNHEDRFFNSHGNLEGFIIE